MIFFGKSRYWNNKGIAQIIKNQHQMFNPQQFGLN